MPIDGLAQLQLVVSNSSGSRADQYDDTRLPSAHTCFNHLLLPNYSSYAILKAKMLYAVHQSSEGFGLR